MSDSFKYDPFGRRIEKVSPTTTSIFAYDGGNLIEETNSSGTVVARYSQGLNIDEPPAIFGRRLELRRSSRGMPQVENFHHMSVFSQLVIDKNGAMRKLADSRSFADRTTHTGEPSQQFDMVQQRSSETRSSLSVVFGNVADDFSEIVQRSLGDEEAVIHFGNSLRTCSSSTVRPALASRMPSSMAARVASSSSSRIGAGFSKSNSLALAITIC